MAFRAYIAKLPIDMGYVGGGGGSILTFPNIRFLGYSRFMQKTNANAPIHSRGRLERFLNVRLLHHHRFAQ
jgi:hypothetical protein